MLNIRLINFISSCCVQALPLLLWTPLAVAYVQECAVRLVCTLDTSRCTLQPLLCKPLVRSWDLVTDKSRTSILSMLGLSCSQNYGPVTATSPWQANKQRTQQQFIQVSCALLLPLTLGWLINARSRIRPRCKLHKSLLYTLYRLFFIPNVDASSQEQEHLKMPTTCSDLGQKRKADHLVRKTDKSRSLDGQISSEKIRFRSGKPTSVPAPFGAISSLRHQKTSLQHLNFASLLLSDFGKWSLSNIRPFVREYSRQELSLLPFLPFFTVWSPAQLFSLTKLWRRQYLLLASLRGVYRSCRLSWATS